MKITTVFAVAVGLTALTACQKAEENAATNMELNAEENLGGTMEMNAPAENVDMNATNAVEETNATGEANTVTNNAY